MAMVLFSEKKVLCQPNKHLLYMRYFSLWKCLFSKFVLILDALRKLQRRGLVCRHIDYDAKGHGFKSQPLHVHLSFSNKILYLKWYKMCCTRRLPRYKINQ